MLDASESLHWLTTYSLTGRLLADQLRILPLQIYQLLVELVVFKVADDRLRQHVIGVVMPADFLDEPGVAGLGFVQVHRQNQ